MDSELSGRIEPHQIGRHAATCSPRALWRAFVGAVALVLSACVSYEPAPLVPNDVLRALSQRAGQDHQIGASGPWQVEWFPLEADVRWEDGISLAEANSLALFFSPALRTARSDARIASALVLQAGVLQNPQLFVGPRISTRNSEVIFPVDLNWRLPLWGTRDAQRDQAKARLSARSLQIIALEIDTLREVRSAFLQLARLRREQAVLDRVVSASREVVGWIERLRDAAEADSAAVFLARTERDEAAADLERIRSQITRNRRELLELLGLLPGAPMEFEAEGAAQLPDLEEPHPGALLRLPELRAAEADYSAAEARLRLEVSKQYPGINLGLQFENDRGDPMLGPGITVDLPLFDRNRGNIAAAEESRDRARESYQRALLGAAHNEARARDELHAAERILAVFQGGALSDVEEAARSLEVRLRTGRADVVEVLAAQRAIGTARSRLLQLEEQVSVARLRAAVAGGLALQAPAAGDEETTK